MGQSFALHRLCPPLWLTPLPHLFSLLFLSASLTIPSATNLIVHLFPEPDKQATAIAIFGGSGAIANIVSPPQSTSTTCSGADTSILSLLLSIEFGLILGGALLLGGWKVGPLGLRAHPLCSPTCP